MRVHGGERALQLALLPRPACVERREQRMLRAQRAAEPVGCQPAALGRRGVRQQQAAVVGVAARGATLAGGHAAVRAQPRGRVRRARAHQTGGAAAAAADGATHIRASQRQLHHVVPERDTTSHRLWQRRRQVVESRDGGDGRTDWTRQPAGWAVAPGGGDVRAQTAPTERMLARGQHKVVGMQRARAQHAVEHVGETCDGARRRLETLERLHRSPPPCGAHSTATAETRRRRGSGVQPGHRDVYIKTQGAARRCKMAARRSWLNDINKHVFN